MDFVQGASNILNMCEGLGHVIEICFCCISDFLVLPVGKSVGKASPVSWRHVILAFQEYLHQVKTACNDGIHCAIGPAVPAVRSSDFCVGIVFLRFLDPAHELLGVVCSTIHALRTNSNTVEGVTE